MNNWINVNKTWKFTTDTSKSKLRIVQTIENVYVDYNKNCTKDEYYEVLDESSDGLKYLIIDDNGSKIYLSKSHFKEVY